MKEKYRAIAYVTVPASKNWRWIGKNAGESRIESEVDTRYVTHINFAFGMIKAYQYDKDIKGRPLKKNKIVSKEAYLNPEDGQYHYLVTVNGWIEEMQSVVHGEPYLHALAKLKEKKPELKVLLSIGGWESDGFCYMSRTEEGRREFIDSCIKLIQEFNIDGIDLDWEYPTNGAWGRIASCEHCVSDARKLLIEFRGRLDEVFLEDHKLLTIASGTKQEWVDAETFHAIDYMNVMCYDFNPGSGGSQADLKLSEKFMLEHTVMVGDTQENRQKINLGVPFYNDAASALVPYCMEWNGYVDTSPEILKEKMNWVKQNNYGGAFYWAYSMDIYEQDVKNPDSKEIKILQRTVFETLNLTEEH